MAGSGSIWSRDVVSGTITATTITADDLEVDSGTLSIDETNNRVGVGLTAPKTALTVEGPVTLKEQANADGDTAAYGQLWVKTATPNQLYFTTDAGDDVQITSGTGLAGSGSAADDITAGDAAVNLTTTSGNITIDAQGSDTDIIFKGTDDSSDITALTLDMSEAGAASFNAAVTVGTDLTVTGGDVSYGNGQDATLSVANTGSGTDGRDLTISAGSAPTGSANQNGGDLLLKSGGGDGTGTSMVAFYSKVSGADAAAERMRIHTNGNVGIGTDAPSQILQVASAAPILVVQNTTNEHTAGGAESKVLFGDHAGNALSQVEGAHSGSSDDAKGQFKVSTNNGTSLQLAMSIDDAQVTTFAANVVVGGTTPKLTIGDAGTEDTMLVFDGNAQDYRIGLDDGTDTLEIGHGTSHGTNTAITIDSSGQVTKFNIPAAAVAQASDHIIFLDGGATGAPKAESIDDFLAAIAGAGISVSSSQLTASGGGAAADDADHILHQQVFSR